MTGERIKVWDWRDAVRQSELRAAVKLTLYTVGLYMNNLGHGAFPSYKTLAKDTGLSKREVMRCVKDAEKAGFLGREHTRRADGSSTSNRYHCLFPAGIVVHDGGDIPSLPAAISELPPSDISSPPGDLSSPGSVAIVTPINSPINSESPLPPLTGAEAGEGAAGKKKILEAGDVENVLEGLPPPVRAVWKGGGVHVLPGTRGDAMAAQERLQACVVPAGIDDLRDEVCMQLAAYIARPNRERLEAEFSEYGWKIKLSGFPLWAVRAAFADYSVGKPKAKPRADQIAVLCAARTGRVLAAINACEKYLAAREEEPRRPPTEDEKAAVDALLAEARRNLASPPPRY